MHIIPETRNFKQNRFLNKKKWINLSTYVYSNFQFHTHTGILIIKIEGMRSR